MNPLNQILLGIGLGVALLITVVIVWLSLSNAHLRLKLAETEAHAAKCELANTEFQQKTTEQNQAIEQLKLEGEDQQKRAALALKEAGFAVVNYQKNIQRMQQEKSSGKDCAATARLLDDYIAGIK